MKRVDAKDVFILGAGFSAPSGAPVVNNFLDVARKIYLEQKGQMDEPIRKSYEAVFDYRQTKEALAAKVNLDLDNIETLFSTLELEAEYLNESLLGTKRQLVWMIVDTLNRTIEPARAGNWTPNDPRFLKYLGERFTSNLPTTSVYTRFVLTVLGAFKEEIRNPSFISFNYDLIVDNVLIGLDVRPDYALPGQFDTAISNKGTVPLIKLHGSANWAMCQNPTCKSDVMFHSIKVAELLKDLQNKECALCKTKESVPLIVPPTWNKGSFQTRMRSVWKRAAQEISSARKLFIIGYSLREADSYFRYLMALALEKNRDLDTVYVVDREASPELKGRYEDMFAVHFRKRRLNLNFMSSGFTSFAADGQLMQAMEK